MPTNGLGLFTGQSSAWALSIEHSEVHLLEYSPNQEVSGDSSTIRRIVTDKILFRLRMSFDVFVVIFCPSFLADTNSNLGVRAVSLSLETVLTPRRLGAPRIVW